MGITNESLKRISEWMNENDLKLAPEKIDVLTIAHKSANSVRYVEIIIEGPT